MTLLLNVLSVIALILGFGFVVFFHELGHFLAAKRVGIKVEQFAVGFGQALFSWRRGLGLRWGSSRKEYERRLMEHLDKEAKSKLQLREKTEDAYTPAELSRASDELGLGETEYRFNWMPLGGYVKMLGQDDLNPNALSDDPRSYNRKSVGARMAVISAGVIMNVILAFLLFMVLFLIGFKSSPAIVPAVTTNSPAQLARPHSLEVGTRVLYLNGQYQHDQTKLRLNIALAKPGRDVTLHVVRPNGMEEDLVVRPRRPGDDKREFLDIGLPSMPYPQLRGLDPKLVPDWNSQPHDPKREIYPGDTITRVNDKPVDVNQYYVLDADLQNSNGKPVLLTVHPQNGPDKIVEVQPRFAPFYGQAAFNIAGMEPRTSIAAIEDASPAKQHLKPGDIVLGVRRSGDQQYANNPTAQQFVDAIRKTSEAEGKVDLLLQRGQDRVEVKDLPPTFKIDKKRKGLGVAPTFDADHPVVASVLPNTPAANAKSPATAPATSPTAGIPAGARILSIDGKSVASWHELRAALMSAQGQATITYEMGEGAAKTTDSRIVQLDDAAHKALADIRYTYTQPLGLAPTMETRKTGNPLVAAAWGIGETRDMLLQFYVTLHRLAQRSVSASNLMGPVGIVHQGALFAIRGPDWLIWFLAMISANLAVVNFLPIPVVDGGHFVFLIIEKIKGKPLSPRMQTVAQLVGLAVIISVFVFVTYQDIARFF